MAYAGGEDEGAAAAALLFVAGGEGDEFGGIGAEGWDRAVAEDQVRHAGEFFVGDPATVERDVEGGDAAPGDCFAVEEFAVVGGGLDGVADGVAEVEDHAEAGFFLVLGDYVGFDLDGGGDDPLEGDRIGSTRNRSLRCATG